MATYSPMDSKVVLRVQTGTDSGGKPVLRSISLMKVAHAASADRVKAVSDALGALLAHEIRGIEKIDNNSVEIA
jgi:hypothetical protein